MSLPSGPQLLDDWIERMHFRSNREAAEFLELNESTVTKLRKARRGVGLEMAIYIERMTGIPVESWSEESDTAVSAGVRNSKKSNSDRVSKVHRVS